MDLRNALIKYWGYSNFRPFQEDIIRNVLSGKDTLAIMPTGGGKSICYQLPAALSEGTCLVVSPLIALMKDQVDRLRRIGISASYITSYMHKKQQEGILSAAIKGDVKLLYVSPERLQSRTFREVLMMMNISFIAVDEAHCISQWGYDFRPPYLKIADIRELKQNVPVLALTATATAVVADDIQKRLCFKQECVISTGFNRDNLAYMVVKDENKEHRLLNIIKKLRGVGIVYVRSRRRTLEIAQFISRYGFKAYYYNAGMPNSQRSANQQAWLNSNDGVMVATNAFGMGIDKPNVRFVVHLDIPSSIEEYFQEAGRAGRDGKESYSVILHHDSDKQKLEELFKLSYPDIDTIRNVYKAVCNYLNIPEGSGKDRSFDFDIDRFAENYNYSVLLVYSVIRLLEREGYLMMNEGLNMPSVVQFIVGYEDIYRLKIENKLYAPILDMLMRGYPGIFTEFVRINEAYISDKLRIKDIRTMLKELERMDILIYTPTSDSPRLIFNIERIDPKYIYFSPDNYRSIKDMARKRLDAVIEYVSTDNKCRNIMLCEYFGERGLSRCGRCDYCISRNKSSNNIIFNEVVNLLKQYRVENPIAFSDIEDKLPNVSREKIIPVIKWLLDNEKVIRNINDDTYYWK